MNPSQETLSEQKTADGETQTHRKEGKDFAMLVGTGTGTDTEVDTDIEN